VRQIKTPAYTAGVFHFKLPPFIQFFDRYAVMVIVVIKIT
jgi:hypothetical protein